MIGQVEQALGIDLDGDGGVGSRPSPAGAAAGSGPGERLAQLERLPALHASGALTDEEFEAEKTRLLGAA